MIPPLVTVSIHYVPVFHEENGPMYHDAPRIAELCKPVRNGHNYGIIIGRDRPFDEDDFEEDWEALEPAADDLNEDDDEGTWWDWELDEGDEDAEAEWSAEAEDEDDDA